MPRCQRCGGRTVKNGSKPIRRKGAIGRRQGYKCVVCGYQFEGDVIQTITEGNRNERL